MIENVLILYFWINIWILIVCLLDPIDWTNWLWFKIFTLLVWLPALFVWNTQKKG